ncbi:glycoside hydrolase family 6 protein [Aspergillus homomorphus CBS 101889]|uniref:Glucanase n=1 Tax=Aspergillus homomorphus (strain CBS 101889) TaxID=1450537 RepID=A0A395HZ59_ASPHC|nr:putative cellobiohydrolase [Aspergillus homomorphus CBS 101889]RAL11544.1 putative cellobiohydrolase [Aspergillus homomorphus CBS 101889]
MKVLWTLAPFLLTAVEARSAASTTANSASAATSASTAAISGNPFSGYQLYANPYYKSEAESLAIPSMSASLAAKASTAAEVPSFYWIDTADKVSTMGTYLKDIKVQNAAGAKPPIAGIFVVYDLPDRDYSAWQATESAPSATAAWEKPDSLTNLVANLNIAKCANAQSAYLECTNYVLKQPNLPNVAVYLDAGHAGWLGWPANIQPAAELYASVYSNASSPAAVRGLATNVANYNAWSVSSCPSYTSGNNVCDEQSYINAFAPKLASARFEAFYIVDTGCAGKQPTGQSAWGDWCNIKGTGFPGGESDETSDSSSARYDAHCGYSDALQPAPEAGTWFQAYFEQFLTKASPAF